MRIKGFVLSVLALLIFGLPGCAGLNFSQKSPEAIDFHPQIIAVLPATVGAYEASRDSVDLVASSRLAKTGWFKEIRDASTIKNRMASEPELSNDVTQYVQKLNALGASDAAMAGKLKSALEADAFFHAYVTAWEYARMEGGKAAKVGIGIKLIDANTGAVVWKANHDIVEKYWVSRPALEKILERLTDELLKEMPH